MPRHTFSIFIQKAGLTLLFLAGLACLPDSVRSAVIITSHADLIFNYDRDADAWEQFIRTGGTSDNPGDQFYAMDEVVFTARDQPAGDGDGERYTQPSGNFEFTGADPGDPLWIMPQLGNTYSDPGFETTMSPGSIASYSETDPRVGPTLQPWITLQFLGLDYFGEGDNAHFALWDSSGARLWMADSDGITANDKMIYTGHSHVNWGFTELGIFRVNVRASAYRGPGATNPTQSEAESVYFAIGTFATWKAGYYTGDELLDPAQSGNLSDSDDDGTTLLEEYAFNMNPDLPDVRYLVPGTGNIGLPLVRMEDVSDQERLVVYYLRRKAGTNPQIQVTAEFSGDMSDPGSWVESTETPDVTSIDATWEQVRMEDDVPVATGGMRVARVVVEILPTTTIQ